MPHQVAFPWLTSPIGRVGRRKVAAVRSLAGRVAPAAVRIPDPRLTQLALQFLPIGPQIFVHEGARQALERRFQTAFSGAVQLGVTDNRRRMVTHTRVRGTLRIRVHMMFLGAPERVLEALVRYVVNHDRQASQVVGEFIDANNHRIRASRLVPGPLRMRGRVHDLYAILAEVSATYFGGVVADVLITWGRRTQPRGSKKRAAIKLGSYSAIERLIRVHPALDNEWVPRYFVSYIVYHELLHHLIPALRVNGRAALHSREFIRKEREFRYYERALVWERKHIDRLLRSR
jgi:hypothetical protein